LALKAFDDLPSAVTPTRIMGLCRMIEAFKVTEVPSTAPVDLPSPADTSRFADFALREFVACVERFTGRGQGWSGHLLTYSKALLDLQALGYAALVAQATSGYKTYIRRIRLGPQAIDKDRPEHTPIAYTPLQLTYWQKRSGDLTFGHQLKYPYGFYGLLAHIQDDQLRQQCQQIAYRIF
jgi:hypothetical protein